MGRAQLKVWRACCCCVQGARAPLCACAVSAQRREWSPERAAENREGRRREAAARAGERRREELRSRQNPRERDCDAAGGGGGEREGARACGYREMHGTLYVGWGLLKSLVQTRRSGRGRFSAQSA
eukprot:1256002-Pleurochrysis_carterae.AAC.2